MKKFVAKTLQEAITKASLEFDCSVTQLDYEVIQNPSKGFLGIGKKTAVIVATKQSSPVESKPQASPRPAQPIHSPKVLKSPPSQIKEPSKPAFNSIDVAQMNVSNIDEVFFKDTSDPKTMTQEIQNELKVLFASMPYRISTIEVDFYDSQTLLVYIDGEDSALIIGEKGYRYKALSYLLFNWIHPKYGYNIRLEIAQFLKNQEEAIDTYLESIILAVEGYGKAQTKPLDGILGYIALKKLREIFPNKYVSFRTNALEERYIVVSDFSKNE